MPTARLRDVELCLGGPSSAVLEEQLARAPRRCATRASTRASRPMSRFRLAELMRVA